MRLSVTEVAGLYRPSKCYLRIYLRSQGIPEDPPDPYEEVLTRLGNRHEQAHLSSLEPVLNLSTVPLEDRIIRTQEAIRAGTKVIYQGAFRESLNLPDGTCEVTGVPDFLIRDGQHYRVRDAKMARRINESDHPEILLQLNIYAWLYEQTMKTQPVCLEVYNGPGELVEVSYQGGSHATSALMDVVHAKKSLKEPYSPVGWSKCNPCAYATRCLDRARDHNDVALVEGVDQGLARALHENGIDTIQQLLKHFDEVTLADFRRPWGTRIQRVGKAASNILSNAEAMMSGVMKVFQKPSLPHHTEYVMFDLEGLPPHLDELGKIYLWGMQVFGERPGPYLPAVALFGPEGDEKGWRTFLSIAQDIFTVYGDIPFVHWHHYEKMQLNEYIKRYGDPDGVAARVIANLLDLLPVTKSCVVLPLPSYGLKVVEKYIGYERTMDEYGGNWSMAQYIEAVETSDENKRSDIMNKILTYNREDLEATWAVWKWLSSL